MDDARPPDRPADSTHDLGHHDPGPGAPASDSAAAGDHCLNCDAPLTDRYCGRCGQDSHGQVLSLRHALRELVEEISQADARVWRTLRLLVVRPGELTCEYLRGKRASYTPPLRLYVALSLLLFLVALLPEAADPEAPPAVRGNNAVSLTPQAAAELETVLKRVDPNYRATLRTQLLNAVRRIPAEQQVRAVQELVKACGGSRSGVTMLGAGVTADLPYQELLDNCSRVTGNGRRLLDNAAEFMPKMMVFFLPLIALFGKLLYLRSRRHYIAHLIFFVHFHAFVFLIMAAGDLASTLTSTLAHLSAARWARNASDLIAFGLVICVAVYLYKAMRRVYGQGRWATCVKLVWLSMAYLINFIVSLILLVGFVALQSHLQGTEWREAIEATGVTITED